MIQLYPRGLSPVAVFVYNGLIAKRRIPPFMTRRVLREILVDEVDTRYAGKWLINATFTVIKTGKPHYMLRDGDVFKVTP